MSQFQILIKNEYIHPILIQSDKAFREYLMR